MTVETPAIPERPHTRWWQSRWLHGALSLAVVALIFGFLFPKVADYGEVWNTIQAMTGLEAASLGLVAMWNLASYWPMLTAVQPGLRLREAAVANLASTAISNTLPGGAALGVGATLTMQRSWGIPVPDTALAAVVAGIWNNFAKLGLPIVALALLALNGQAGPGLAVAALVGLAVLVAAIAVFAVLLRSPELAARVGAAAGTAVSAVRRLFRRGPVSGWDERARRFRADIIGLLAHRWMRITVSDARQPPLAVPGPPRRPPPRRRVQRRSQLARGLGRVLVRPAAVRRAADARRVGRRRARPHRVARLRSPRDDEEPDRRRRAAVPGPDVVRAHSARDRLLVVLADEHVVAPVDRRTPGVVGGEADDPEPARPVARP